MSFGFEAYNNGGYLQVNNSYVNLALQLKQTFSLGGGGTTTVTYTSANSPIFFINSTGYVGVTGLSVSGTTYVWYVGAASSSTGAFYVFDTQLTNATSGFGIIVNDTLGNQIFNSTNKYMRVTDLIQVPFSNSGDYGVSGSTVTNTYTYPSGTYAVGLSQPRVNVRLGAGSGGSNLVTWDASQCSSTGVSIANNYSQSVGTLPTTTGIYEGSGNIPAMVINVSGY